ncbi:MAG: 2-C-methyl-D-erythritol 2,4-cyclodiphosphate synthase [Candidatus Omnitrophica bacterium]|nr:2-C-methyl-D-erythritol 2,4-cyclodiphosphate synthase [Candidatus Omnitrophota bacterium]
MRVGIGYDVHRLVEGRRLMLGGVDIPYSRGLEGHSDGDALLHAICDAILGALGKGDIGMFFPDTDARYRNIESIELLKEVMGVMDEEGYRVINLDSIVIAAEPKIGPYREEMIRTISNTLKILHKDVNIKGKSSNNVGPVGDGEAIAAYAVVLVDNQWK